MCYKRVLALVWFDLFLLLGNFVWRLYGTTTSTRWSNRVEYVLKMITKWSHSKFIYRIFGITRVITVSFVKPNETFVGMSEYWMWPRSLVRDHIKVGGYLITPLQTKQFSDGTRELVNFMSPLRTINDLINRLFARFFFEVRRSYGYPLSDTRIPLYSCTHFSFWDIYSNKWRINHLSSEIKVVDALWTPIRSAWCGNVIGVEVPMVTGSAVFAST